jgi:hypothetical protein
MATFQVWSDKDSFSYLLLLLVVLGQLLSKVDLRLEVGWK